MQQNSTQADRLQSVRNQLSKRPAAQNKQRSWASLKTALAVGSVAATLLGAQLLTSKDEVLAAAQSAGAPVVTQASPSQFSTNPPVLGRNQSNGVTLPAIPSLPSFNNSNSGSSLFNNSSRQSFRPLTRSRSSR
ncbi:MAG: hypothetical protein R3C14_23885 [Caldilineaceae bacterium]